MAKSTAETRQVSAYTSHTANIVIRPMQIVRLTELRNECNTRTKLHPEIAINHALNTLHTKIAQTLKPSTPLLTSEAHQQCSKAVGTIVSNTLSDKLRDKENKSYDKSPKHYHIYLKISTGLLPRARDQPRVTPLTNPLTITIHTNPQEVIDIVTSSF
jgi:hypothetical protein